jgi:hypothetical protein
VVGGDAGAGRAEAKGQEAAGDGEAVATAAAAGSREGGAQETHAHPRGTSTASGKDAQPKSIPEVAERAALPTVALVGAPAPNDSSALLPNSGRKVPNQRVQISGIGFRPLGGGEVIVRSDRPVEYEVSAADSAVLIHLRSAHIPLQNNRRPLDTRYFEGPIQRVVPLQVPGGTDIRIELRQRAEVHLEQSGPLLTVSFTPRG